MLVVVVVLVLLVRRTGRRFVIVAVAVVMAVPVVVAVPVAVVMAVGRAFRQCGAQEPEADSGDHQPADEAEYGQHGLPRQRRRERQRETERQHPRGMGEGDGDPDGDGIPGRAAAPRQVRGHDGLSVAGQRGVRGAEHEGEQQGQKSCGNGQFTPPHERVEDSGHLVQRRGERSRSRQHRSRHGGGAALARFGAQPGRPLVQGVASGSLG